MNNTMTIEEVQGLLQVLEANITLLLQEFKTKTGLIVHSVPIEEKGATVMARVKIQIPGV